MRHSWRYGAICAAAAEDCLRRRVHRLSRLYLQMKSPPTRRLEVREVLNQAALESFTTLFRPQQEYQQLAWPIRLLIRVPL